MIANLSKVVCEFRMRGAMSPYLPPDAFIRHRLCDVELPHDTAAAETVPRLDIGPERILDLLLLNRGRGNVGVVSAGDDLAIRLDQRIDGIAVRDFVGEDAVVVDRPGAADGECDKCDVLRGIGPAAGVDRRGVLRADGLLALAQVFGAALVDEDVRHQFPSGQILSKEATSDAVGCHWSVLRTKSGPLHSASSCLDAQPAMVREAARTAGMARRREISFPVC